MAGKEEEQRRGGGTTWAATIILQALVVGLPTGRTWLLPDVKNVWEDDQPGHVHELWG